MEFTLATAKKFQIIDITEKVSSIAAGKANEGICCVFIPHTTASVIINEFEPMIEQDFLKLFSELLPKAEYKHDSVDDNAGAHLKAAIFSSSQCIPISKGKLALGTWQRILFCEFDGPRANRKVIVTVN